MRDRARDALQVSHRKVWTLAGPIILSNLSQPLVGAVDTAVVGHLPGPESIGAVALGALIFSFLFWGFGFLRMGTTGIAARCYGTGDEQYLADTLLRVLCLAVGLGLLIVLLGSPMMDFAFYLLEASVEVEGLAADYAAIRILGAPAVLCGYAISGLFIGTHDTRSAFVLQLVLNLVNLSLDLLFVLGFGWGVEGVALASVLAEYLALALGLYLLRGRLAHALAHYDRARLFDRQALGALFDANANIFVRTLCLLFAFSYFTAVGAKQGEVILAANAVLMHLQSIMAAGLDGFAHAVEAMAGSTYGAGRRRLFRRAIRYTSAWGLALAILVSISYYLFGEAILAVFTSIDAVLAAAAVFLPWMIASPLLSLWSFQLDGIFIGTGHTREMRNAMVVSVLAYLLLLEWLIPAFGNHGLYAGLMIFMLLRAASLLFYLPAIEAAMGAKRAAA